VGRGSWRAGNMLPSDGWLDGLGDAACIRAVIIRCRYVCCAAVAPLRVDTLVILLIFLIIFAIVFSLFFHSFGRYCV
jgi:hypothetical protein